MRIYTLHLVFSSFFSFFLNACENKNLPTHAIKTISEEEKVEEIKVGAARFEKYIDFLQSKRIGIVGNQTSVINGVHLVDTLINLGIDINKIYSPEHGFRGKADAGEAVNSTNDEKTGLPIVSLYGNNKKPSKEQVKGIDIILFDMQDVGARFYTYISTLHYVMETCAENEIQLIVLDRPNPNGSYVDGPIRQEAYKSFVGMHPIPIVHGMTIGEYAQMINGENWLTQGLKTDLMVIPCENYDRNMIYELPISPSPNLKNSNAIALYPSLCLFEGTILSEGRGTDYPFELFGHPTLPKEKYTYTFTPKSRDGAKYPKLENKVCHGKLLTDYTENNKITQIHLEWLIEAYQNFPNKSEFFITKNRWFDILAGTDALRKSIIEGKTAEQIRESWKEDLDVFLEVRKKYLIYSE